MQNGNIEHYLTDDSILNKINKQFISLDINDVKTHNQHLNEVLTKLIEAMRQQSPLFNKTFQKILWVGSYYEKTRVGEPEEYDINFVINLPFEERDITFSSDQPGYTKILTPWTDRDMSHDTLNLEKALKELKSLIDNQSYLNQEKFRTWIESILSKVAHETSKSSRIVLSGDISITIKKAGPAFTLSFQLSGKSVDIDVVPVLLFSSCKTPPNCSKLSILEKYQPADSRYWSVVPKPLNNSKASFSDARHRYWRLCFYEFEKDILDNYNYGRIKPIIRHLKKLRDTQKWNIASYYIKTLCLNELDIFRISNRQSFTSLFFTMLQKLREAFRESSIRYYWDKDLNLLEHIGRDEMRGMTGRINHIIQTIEKTIANDKYAIARYILNDSELETLQSLSDQSNSKSLKSSESELESEMAGDDPIESDSNIGSITGREEEWTDRLGRQESVILERLKRVESEVAKLKNERANEIEELEKKLKKIREEMRDEMKRKEKVWEGEWKALWEKIIKLERAETGLEDLERLENEKGGATSQGEDTMARGGRKDENEKMDKALKVKVQELLEWKQENEKRERRKCLMIRGLKWDGRKPMQKTKDFLQDRFNLGHKMVGAWCEGGARNRKLGVQMVDVSAKIEVVRRKKELGEDHPIFIDEILSKEEEERQWRLRGIARVVRGWGEHTKVRFNRVYLVNRWFSWRQIEKREHVVLLAQTEEKFRSEDGRRQEEKTQRNSVESGKLSDR